MKHFLLIFVMLLAACGSETEIAEDATAVPQAATEPAPAEPIEAEDAAFTIVMLGDSLTAGYGLDREDALPEQMGAIFQRNGYQVNMVNAGVSGDTTAGGLARYDFSVKSAEPDLLVVALGANDFINGMSAAAARANLAAIIEKAQSDGVAVILASGAGRSVTA